METVRTSHGALKHAEGAAARSSGAAGSQAFPKATAPRSGQLGGFTRAPRMQSKALKMAQNLAGAKGRGQDRVAEPQVPAALGSRGARRG